MLALSLWPSMGQPMVHEVCGDAIVMSAALLKAIPQFVCESANNTGSHLVTSEPPCTFSKYVIMLWIMLWMQRSFLRCIQSMMGFLLFE